MKRQKVFSGSEIKFLAAMGLVMGFRELSLSMLNPFITLFGNTLRGSTTFLCGLAMGIFGLANALFQIPYGSLSDRIGRKPVILIGLTQLLVGLLLAGLAQNVYLFIFARALQGSGAVTAIAYSWIGDDIADSKKSRAMAIAGIIVALGAVIAFVAGPVLYNITTVNNMFLGCSVMILFSILFILFFIEDKRDMGNVLAEKNSGIGIKEIKLLIRNRSIIFLSISGFIFNFAMSEMFFIVPDELKNSIGAKNMWYVFLPAVLFGIIAMNVANTISDNGYFTQTAITVFFMLALGFVCFMGKVLVGIAVGTILIVTGFMCLTTGIPSVMNKIFHKEKRGTANGILQTMTFLGFFAGPTITGFFMQHRYVSLVYIVPILLSVLGAYCIKGVKHAQFSYVASVDN
ncbi:MAG: MFS transporter [Bacillota bacterium]|nr:MFS transporter [Bacillota bacterium]